MPMSATPSDPKTAADGQPAIADPTLTFGNNLHQLWTRHSNLITAVCVVILLAILGKGGWDFYQAQRETAVEGDYAAASTPDKLKTFAAANPGHMLAGVAQLQLADQDYTAGKFAEAQAGYDQAAATLKTGPFAARAQLGSAMSKLGAGKNTEAEAALKQISNDTTQLKGIRAEATYRLASLSVEAGRPDDVTKYSDQLMQIDASSPWTQRALQLRASLPVTAAAPKPAAAVTTPSVQLTVPGK
jgi:hypothetical protein